MVKIIDGGVTAANGFAAASTHAGIKKNSTKDDRAFIFSKVGCVTAGTFTLNKVFAAPVKWDKARVYSEDLARAVVINSGVANACTGKEGDDACLMEAEAISEALSVPVNSCLVASTGVIGAQLPMTEICNGIKAMAPSLEETREAANKAAVAIMTTDTKPKEVAVEVELSGKKVTIGGMCKGAGMIHPNMATMLCFITTDAAIDKKLLQEATSAIVDDSFNMISVDGDTSTNDTVLVLANGLANNEKIVSKNEDYKNFYEGLSYVLTELSKKIAGDGEGATCLFECQLKNAKTKQDAKILAKSVITSNLTKAAIFGHDANWGRILCALGYSGAEFDPEKVDIFFESAAGKLQIVKDGVATDYSEDEATKILSQNPVVAICDVKDGEYDATAWGCDLTFDYVKINADYRS